MAYFGLKDLDSVKKHLKLCFEIRNKQLPETDPRIKDIREMMKLFNLELE